MNKEPDSEDKKSLGYPNNRKKLEKITHSGDKNPEIKKNPEPWGLESRN